MNYRIFAPRVKRGRTTPHPHTPPPPAIAGGGGTCRVAVVAVVYRRMTVATEMQPEIPAGRR
jgi:hypothetical protein